MSSEPVELLTALEKINWLGRRHSSPLLEKYGYRNGVCGYDDSSYNEFCPHHAQQVHRTEVIAADHRTHFKSLQRPSADGLYTTENLPIAVKTADCLPILLGATDTRFAMAIHAGWRGLTAGILTQALKLARRYTEPRSIVALIGPAISLSAFEVGREVVDSLRVLSSTIKTEDWSLAVHKGKSDRWHVDLQLAAVIQLYREGLSSSNIEVIRSCTRDDIADPTHSSIKLRSPAWHSYRRDGKDCGSNWTWICPT